MTATLPDRTAEIDAALTAVEAETGARILFAVESGSRAWGFPSPDSDWDVRFIHAMPTRWHLALRPGRDVIERMLPGDLDLSGWEAKKALNLLLAGNATLREWLRSPVVYRADAAMLAAFRDLATAIPAREPARHHYIALARRQWERHLAVHDQVELKRYLYAVRPALVLRWMRLNEAGDPPMDVPELRAGASLAPTVSDALDALLAAKAVSRELGHGARVAPLDALVAEEISLAEARTPGPYVAQPDSVAAAQALFLRCCAHADQFP